MRAVAGLAAVVSLTLTMAACGDDDYSRGDVLPASIEIEASDFAFSPSSLKATAGYPQAFVISNMGVAPHTLKVFRDEDHTQAVEGADTGNIAKGAAGQLKVVLDEGTYYFLCELHPDKMTGTIAAN